MIKFQGVKSNWELILFYIVDKYVNDKKRRFSRTQLLRGHADKIYSIFTLLGHKINPSKMDQTIQKTLQNMRDKDWIIFLGSYNGEYELTDAGYKELLRHKDHFKTIDSFSNEDMATAGELAKKLYK